MSRYVFLKDIIQRPEWGLNPRPLDPESEVLTSRPRRPGLRSNKEKVSCRSVLENIIVLGNLMGAVINVNILSP